MAKKLIFVWLSITIIACSSISIYATTTPEGNQTETTINTSEITKKVASHTTKKIKAITSDAKEQAKADARKAAAEAKAAKERAELKAKEGNKINQIVNYILRINGNVGQSAATQMANYFVREANANNVDVLYLVAIAKHESNFYTNVTSSAGCKGLMQTSDTLANKYGYSSGDAYNPEIAIKIGAKYLKECLDIFNGDYMKALSGYGYGCGAVKSGNFSYNYANEFTAIRNEI